MGLTLGPVLAGIFMVQLGTTISPTFREQMSALTRYVYDSMSYIKEESIEYVLSKLNGYQDNINVIFEIARR